MTQTCKDEYAVSIALNFYSTKLSTQVRFAELKKTDDDRANIGRTIIGARIVGQQLARYILSDHQDADCRPTITLILSRQL